MTAAGADTVRLHQATAQVASCPGCGDVCEPDAKFCGGCGIRLWNPCLACEQPNAIQKAFCGSCGTDLAATLESTKQAITSALRTANEHSQEGELGAAQRALGSVELPTVEHTALTTLTAQFRELGQLLKQRHEEAIEQMDGVVEAASEALEAGDHRRALVEIGRVPKSVRNGRLKELHKQASACCEEVARLRTEIKQKLAAKEYDGLLTVAQRLLGLEPSDLQVSQLVDKLIARQKKLEGNLTAQLLESAERALGANDYPAAGKALDSLPVETDSQLTERLDLVKERVWLARQLARAPYATLQAVRLAERFFKHQPADQRLAKTVQQIQARYKESQATKLLAAWAKSPSAGVLGVSVEAADVPSELAAAAKTAKTSPYPLRQAYGLARQAIGAASLAVDLTPKSGSRWSVPLGLGRKKPTSGWGIDAGSHSIKAIRVAAAAGNESPEIEEVVTLPVNESYSLAIAELLGKIAVKGLPVVVNLPSIQTLGRFFELPAPEGKRSKFDEAIRFEARTRIPLKPEEAVIDYCDRPIVEAGDTTGIERRYITLLAAKRQDAEVRLSPLATAGASSVVLGSGVIASAGIEGLETEEADGTTALLHIGHRSTTLLVSDPRCLWFRAMYGGVEDFDREIAKRFKTDLAGASQLRRQIEKATNPHLVDDALREAFAPFTQRISRSLDQFQSEFGRSIDHLRVCGGGLESFGIVRYLRTGQ